MTFTSLQRASALFLLAFPSLALAECDATYSVNFAANYHNNVTVKCTVEDMDLITRVIHSVVELDSISSRLSREVPDFKFMFERFGEDVLVVNGDEYTPEAPDAAEADKHLTAEDLVQEMYYEQGLDGGDHHDQAFRPPPGDEVAPVEYAEPFVAADPEHRRAQLMDCSLMEQCTDMWCCQVCGFCWARRQRKLAARKKDAASDRSYLRSNRAPSAEEGQEDDNDESEHDEAYLRRVKLHEERVSKELLKKFRYMMRKDTIPCLGNFWELKVFFKMVI